MFYDISNEEQKSQLTTIIRRWKQDAKSAHDLMHEEWDECDDYFENEQVPAGFSEEHLEHLADANNPTKPSMNTKQFVVVNKVRETHEAVLGDFIGARKHINVRGNSPRDRKLGKAVGKVIDHVQRRAQLWDEVMIPAIDCAIRRGNHWIKLSYNATRDLPTGLIEIEEISCRDILLDPDVRKTFYTDKKYLIHRLRYRKDVADEKFREYFDPHWTGFSIDRDYDDAYKSSSGTNEQFVTIYEVHYVMTEVRYFLHNPKSNAPQELSLEDFNRASKDPVASKLAFKYTEDVLYKAFFQEAEGVFYNDQNEFQVDMIIPVLNIRSEGRAYAFGDTKYYKNLQDLFNTLLSVILDNAKKGNRPWISVDPQSYALNANKINEAINNPGKKVIPAANVGVHYPREINQAVVQLLTLTEKYIYDLQAKHDASRGQLPTNQIAEKTVANLIQQDRQSHGRKDVMIRWAMTMVARSLWEIIRLKFTEEQWVQVTDSVRGDDDYVPINYILNEEEYKQLLTEMLGVESDELLGTMEAAQLQKQMVEFRKQFEKENEVRKEVVTSFVIEGVIMKQEEVDVMMRKEDLEPEEFEEKYHPEQRDDTVYVINDLTRDAELDVVFDIDFNYEADKQTRQNMAFALFDRAVLRGDRLLKDVDYPDPDAAWKESVEQNQILQLGQAIVDNQPLYQQVMAVLNGQPAAPAAKTAPKAKAK